MATLRALWLYRGFIAGSVKRDFQSRYQNSLLGAAWPVLHPLAMIVVYTLIFSQVMRARLPGADSPLAYSIYLCAGLLAWGLFAEIAGRAQNTFVDHANLLKKLNFPRVALPATVVATALLNFTIIFLLFTLFLVISGNFPGWAILGLIPVLAILVAFAIGLGVTLGILNVFFRDIGQLFVIVLQFWFWLTPIVYPIGVLPEPVGRYLDFNPMARLIGACQDILVHSRWPDLWRLAPVFVLSALTCMFALALFRKHAGEMIDEL